VEFVMEEILTNPTQHGVQLALIPAEPAELVLELRAAGEAASLRSARVSVRARELAVLRVEGLSPGTAYGYSVLVRRPGDGDFTRRAGESFRTLREGEGGEFRFAYVADSHIVGWWMKATCHPRADYLLSFENFQRTLSNIEDSGVDFVIAGGDNFMVHSPRFLSCEGYEEYGNGTARSAEEADLRYAAGLAPGTWGRLGRRLPLLYVLGNHDGEARFGDALGSYGHFEDTWSLSRQARLRHLPDSTDVYDGARDGALYYTFTSGDARFIILDVMSGPRDYPRGPEDWTLGPTQLEWFTRVLRENDRTWTFVFLEHLVGGSPHLKEGWSYHYGRGGLRATQDRSVRGLFVGEQALLQRRMAEHSVDVVFHAHDHVAVVGEKLDRDGRGEGVIYALGGEGAGGKDTPPWQQRAWFREEMDYDENGVADFLEGATGSVGAGFYRVTVAGSERGDLAYVQSDPDPALDGRTAFEVSLFADGTSTLSAAREVANRASVSASIDTSVVPTANSNQAGR
jgi:hypothetical protein